MPREPTYDSPHPSHVTLMLISVSCVGNVEFAEDAQKVRVRPLVVDDESAVDRHLGPVREQDVVRVRVAAEAPVRLVKGHAVAVPHRVGGREAGDAGSNDGDARLGAHRTLPARWNKR